jgi:hypothetical protein
MESCDFEIDSSGYTKAKTSNKTLKDYENLQSNWITCFNNARSFQSSVSF